MRATRNALRFVACLCAALSLTGCWAKTLIRPEPVEITKREFVKVDPELTQPHADPEQPVIRTGATACLDTAGREVLCADQAIELAEGWKRVAHAERCDKGMIACLQAAPEDIQAFMQCFTKTRRAGGLCAFLGP